MRRAVVLAVVLAVGVTVLAGCTSRGASPRSWQDTPSSAAAATGPGSTYAVCVQLQTVIAADLVPVGKALGKLVGLHQAGTTSGVADAQRDAEEAIKKLGTDVSSTAATATDPSVQAAGRSAETAIDALATTTFVASITSVDTIATATQQLQQATAPVATACSA